MVKNPLGSAGDLGSIPGSGRSLGGENGNPFQYSCLGNPMAEEPGGLQSMGLHRVGLNDLAHIIMVKLGLKHFIANLAYFYGRGWEGEREEKLLSISCGC